MVVEQFRWLGGVIAAHPDRKVVGRTRLQKEIRLLQRCGLPTAYRFMLYFYGPYSEGVQSDVSLLENLGLIREESRESAAGAPYYVLEATHEASLPDIEAFRGEIDRMANTDAVVLELAATYDAFRELGFGHESALERLHDKKGAKCGEGREGKAFALLDELGLLGPSDKKIVR